jgi:hypothetical protein
MKLLIPSDRLTVCLYVRPSVRVKQTKNRKEIFIEFNAVNVVENGHCFPILENLGQK